MRDDILKAIPVLSQRQDSQSEQLRDLLAVANRLGMYDAADAIRSMFDENTLPAAPYGCHCDLVPGEQPDGCVLDEGKPEDCVHAHPGMRKEQCHYWRLVQEPGDGA
ncbi:hypothetical protein [Thioalkalivibrio sp. ALE16]|uniref:hypothetical protein n=1 Tax=Thioalkalivibrio sp. ALE16 TaxID=1158172 RepID=UPI00035D2167|nr:hypothetical protein [Thioalkalivibrio sp. ALE16]